MGWGVAAQGAVIRKRRKPAELCSPGKFPARKPITRGNVVQISQFVTREIQFPRLVDEISRIDLLHGVQLKKTY